jgi:hypothetical protein
MICAKRRLTWKEIQVALSIDADSQTIKYDDRRLRKHIHDICGSLVSLDGDRVSLVHSTAKTYVHVRTKQDQRANLYSYITKVTDDIHEPSIECELAILCLNYLTFPCFDVEEVTDEQEMKTLILEGHLAFQDYAVAKWFHHINALIYRGEEFTQMQATMLRDNQLERLECALEDFINCYHREDWTSIVVEDCKANCVPFQSWPLYGNLVSLTSHIYTFQQKGFEARHQISIKNLGRALDRNRKLLEDLPSKLDNDELAEFHNFYDGEKLYKCTKITCRYFSEGFKDAKTRKKHVNIHERPFHCDVPDCLGAEGFANQGDLQK